MKKVKTGAITIQGQTTDQAAADLSYLSQSSGQQLQEESRIALFGQWIMEDDSDASQYGSPSRVDLFPNSLAAQSEKTDQAADVRPLDAEIGQESDKSQDGQGRFSILKRVEATYQASQLGPEHEPVSIMIICCPSRQAASIGNAYGRIVTETLLVIDSHLKQLGCSDDTKRHEWIRTNIALKPVVIAQSLFESDAQLRFKVQQKILQDNAENRNNFLHPKKDTVEEALRRIEAIVSGAKHSFQAYMLRIFKAWDWTSFPWPLQSDVDLLRTPLGIDPKVGFAFAYDLVQAPIRLGGYENARAWLAGLKTECPKGLDLDLLDVPKRGVKKLLDGIEKNHPEWMRESVQLLLAKRPQSFRDKYGKLVVDAVGKNNASARDQYGSINDMKELTKEHYVFELATLRQIIKSLQYRGALCHNFPGEESVEETGQYQRQLAEKLVGRDFDDLPKLQANPSSDQGDCPVVGNAFMRNFSTKAFKCRLNPNAKTLREFNEDADQAMPVMKRWCDLMDCIKQGRPISREYFQWMLEYQEGKDASKKPLDMAELIGYYLKALNKERDAAHYTALVYTDPKAAEALLKLSLQGNADMNRSTEGPSQSDGKEDSDKRDAPLSEKLFPSAFRGAMFNPIAQGHLVPEESNAGNFPGTNRPETPMSQEVAASMVALEQDQNNLPRHGATSPDLLALVLNLNQSTTPKPDEVAQNVASVLRGLWLLFEGQKGDARFY